MYGNFDERGQFSDQNRRGRRIQSICHNQTETTDGHITAPNRNGNYQASTRLLCIQLIALCTLFLQHALPVSFELAIGASFIPRHHIPVVRTLVRICAEPNPQKRHYERRFSSLAFPFSTMLIVDIIH